MQAPCEYLKAIQFYFNELFSCFRLSSVRLSSALPLSNVVAFKQAIKMLQRRLLSIGNREGQGRAMVLECCYTVYIYLFMFMCTLWIDSILFIVCFELVCPTSFQKWLELPRRYPVIKFLFYYIYKIYVYISIYICI